jgi:phosphoglycerol transferase
MRSSVRVAAAAAVFALLLAVPVLRLWRADLGVPLYARGDQILHELVVDSTLDHGWYLHDPDLAAPLGGDLAQFPMAETLPLLVVKAFDVVIDSPTVALNLFYVLTFPAVAAVAAAAFRRLGAAPAPAIAAGVLYAFLPYHFVRNQGHAFLSLYVAAPILGVLMVETLSGRPVLDLASGRGLRRFLSRRSLVGASLCLVVGTSSVYYAAFGAVLLPLCGLLRAVGERRWKVLVAPCAAALICLGATAPQMLPGIVERMQGDSVADPATRTPGQSELLALRLIDLVLPVRDHVVAPQGHLTERFQEGTLISNVPEVPDSAALGLTATIGLGMLAVRGATGALGLRRRAGNGDAGDSDIDDATAVAVALTFLTATLGGVGALVAYFLTSQVRAWARLSVLIAFFCLLAVARALGPHLARAKACGGSRPATVLGCVALVGVGLLDQAPPGFVPPYEDSAATHEQLAPFTREIAASLPDGASVLQLPMVSFPERTLLRDMPHYEQIRPMLYTDTLRWSAGAVSGTSQDWAAPLVGRDPYVQLLAGAALGFDAVWLDLRGVEDPAATRSQFVEVLGPPDFVTAFVGAPAQGQVWDLRPHRAGLAAEAATAADADTDLRAAIDAAGGPVSP